MSRIRPPLGRLTPWVSVSCVGTGAANQQAESLHPFPGLIESSRRVNLLIRIAIDLNLKYPSRADQCSRVWARKKNGLP